MADPLHIQPHPEAERSYYDLREQFRADNVSRIRALLNDYRVNGVKMKLMGTPLALQGGTTPEKRAELLLAALDAPVTQDFGLADVPADIRKQLDDLLGECETFERVTWDDSVAGVVEHDGPAVPIEVEMMTEAEQITYVDHAIEASRRK